MLFKVQPPFHTDIIATLKGNAIICRQSKPDSKTKPHIDYYSSSSFLSSKTKRTLNMESFKFTHACKMELFYYRPMLVLFYWECFIKPNNSNFDFKNQKATSFIISDPFHYLNNQIMFQFYLNVIRCQYPLNLISLFEKFLLIINHHNIISCIVKNHIPTDFRCQHPNILRFIPLLSFQTTLHLVYNSISMFP